METEADEGAPGEKEEKEKERGRKKERKEEKKPYRHVVGALGAVAVQVLAAGAGGGGDAVEGVAHVGADVVVPVLVEGERAARVLHEQVQQPDAVLPQLRLQLLHHVLRHQVRAPRPRRQRELLLEPGHRGRRRGRGQWWWW